MADPRLGARPRTGDATGGGRRPSRALDESEGNTGGISEGSAGDPATRRRPSSGRGDFSDEPLSRPVFYYDLASPEAYLAAERVNHMLAVVPEWEPVLVSGLAAASVGCFRCAEEELIFRTDVERRAAAYGLQPVRWPAPFPTDTAWAMRAATFAKRTGRAVAFSLAAFRQAFAAGRDLGDRESVLIAAAACELHPAAVTKGAELRGTARRLEEATAAAARAGVLDVPAVRIGDRVFHGDRELDLAAEAMAA